MIVHKASKIKAFREIGEPFFVAIKQEKLMMKKACDLILTLKFKKWEYRWEEITVCIDLKLVFYDYAMQRQVRSYMI